MHLRLAVALLLLPALAAAQAGTYTTFGAGCAGSKQSGWVLPRSAVTAWGNTSDTRPIGLGPIRMQQQFDHSELPTTRQVWDFLAMRSDETLYSSQASVQTLKVLIGTTKYSSQNLSSSFANNVFGILLTVFDGTVHFPGLPKANNDLTRWDYIIKFPRPLTIGPIPKGENLLIEIWNSTKTAPPHRVDQMSLGAKGAILTAITWTDGYVSTGRALVMMLGSLTGPALSTTGVPTLGSSFPVDLDVALPSATAALVTGRSASTWVIFALPIDLGPAGAPGCSLRVSYDAVTLLQTDTAGKGTVKLPVPNDSRLLGATFHNQFFVYDQRANPLGLAWSNGGSGMIGR